MTAENNRVLYVIANEHILHGGIFYSQVMSILSEIKRLDRDTVLSLLYFAPAVHWIRCRKELKSLAGELKDRGIDFTVCPVLTRGLWVKAFMLPLFVATALPVLLYVSRSRQVRIIHCRSYPAALIGLLGRRLSKCKVIFDMRGLYVDEGSLRDPAWAPRRLNFKVWKRLEKIMVARADTVVVVSRPFATQVQRIHYRAVKVINCVAPGGVRQARTKEGQARTADDGGYREVRVVYSGSIGNWTTIDDLSDAFKGIKRIIPRAILRVVTQNDIDETREAIERTGLPRQDFAVTSLPAGRVDQYLRRCDIGLLIRKPSIINEVAFPVKFAEYLSAGVPVVVNPAARAIAELVEELHVGVVVDFKDEIEAGRRLTIFWRDLGKAARNCAAASALFSTTEGARKYLSIYTALAAPDMEEAWN